MEITAITRNVRLSAQKGRPLARKVQGLPVAEALQVTQFSPLKAAFHLGKTLKAAMANARHNDNLDVDSLRVKLAVFDEGARLPTGEGWGVSGRGPPWPAEACRALGLPP